MSAWWERYPTAYAAEVAAWQANSHLGYTWRENEAAKTSGRLVIEVEWPRENEVLTFTAEYPDTFPYFQAVVRLTNKQYERHQNPTGGNLCLLGREGEAWQPGRDTAAAVFVEKFPVIEKINSGEMSDEEVQAKEDHVGEPVSSFLEYLPGSVIIVPDQTPEAHIEYGQLKLKVRSVPQTGNGLLVSGVLKTILDAKQNPLVEFSATIPPFEKEQVGFWMRLPERPEVSGDLAKRLHDLLSEKSPAFKVALARAKRGQFVIAGFVYPDEVSWRKNVDDWAFLAIEVCQEAKRSRQAQYRGRFIRADWGGEDAWQRRAPALRSLRKRSVLLVGAGAVGSPVALQLARAGVAQLHMVDSDNLQVGNTSRWALGWRMVGFQKTQAIAEFVKNEYPYTKTKITACRIGFPRHSNEEFSDYEVLVEAVKKADLVIDASANQRVTHFLADLASEFKKPFLWLSITPGAAGGVVGRVLPGESEGCFHCYQYGLGDGTIPQPPDYGIKEIQPAGCSQPTYVGAGVDSDEVALLASRLAVATLCRGETDGYSDFCWDVAIATLAKLGESVAPEWVTRKLTKHAECKRCASK